MTPTVIATREDRRIDLSGMRKAIADRLFASKTQIPHFYLRIDVDADQLVKLRKQLNEQAAAEEIKYSYNDLILKAVIAALVRVPRVNATYQGDHLIEFGAVQLAVAVAVEDGLVTPVIRNAQAKSLREIHHEIKDLAARARTKKLKPEEYQGGTFTVSNLGNYGIDGFDAIINPPQAGILSVGNITKQAVVNEHDQIVVGHRMSLGMSCDHRVVDGAVGAEFLRALRQYLECPALMFASGV
jgi:pyruvate dehydrogenase E2 component (dihydrolipoamide acetyltransferase)